MMEKQAKALKLWFLILSLFLSNFVSSPVARASQFVQYWQNRFSTASGLVLEPRFSLFSSSANFDADGNKSDLANDVSVSRLYFDGNVYDRFDEDWTLFGRLTLLNASVKSPGGDSSTLSLGDQLAGVAYRLLHQPGGTQLTLQGEVTLPTYSNGAHKQNGDPYPGDGSYDFTFGTFASMPLDRKSEWSGEAGLGYRVRSHAYSSALPWSLMVQRDPVSNGFLFGAGLRGQFSLNTDQSSASAAAADQLLGAGGSQIIYAINPSWTVAQLSLGYQDRPGQSFYALAATPISGKNAPAGFQLSLGARLAFGTEDSNRPAAMRAREAPRGKAEAHDKEKPKVTDRKTPEPGAYNLIARITSINDQLYVAKIDKGSGDGIEKGQMFDVFELKIDPETHERKETRVARAKVTAVKRSETALSVIEYFVDQWVEIGFVAKRLVE